MKFIHQTDKIIELENQIFLHHTGNMYGLGASVTSLEGIQKIDQIKGRDSEKSYICLFDSIQSIINEKMLDFSQKKFIRLLNKVWPGNITVLLPVTHEKYLGVNRDGYIAVRVPTSSFLREWLSKVGPIISSSVNKSNEKAMDHLDDILNQYNNDLDFAIIEKDLSVSISGPSTLIKFENNHIAVLRQGTILSDQLMASLQDLKISFACIGNTCRSPIAEYYAKQVLVDLPYQIKISSCGLNESGHPISKNSEQILKEMGIQSALHRSTQANQEILKENDYVLCMTDDIKKRMIELFPKFSFKILTLGELSGLNTDVDDPYGNDYSTYEKTAQIIKEMIDQLRIKLIKQEI